MSKHTPAPWVIIPAQPYDGDEEEFEGAYVSPASIEGADGNPVCAFGIAEGSGHLFENEADYHLIAAAPDLQASVQDLVAFVGVMLGRGSSATIPETIATPLGAHVKIGQIMRDAQAALAKAEGSP